MSRVTPPVTKFTQAIRKISSSATVAHPSGLLAAQVRTSALVPRKLSDLKAECNQRQLKTTGSKTDLVDRLDAYHTARSHSTTSGHRPTTPQSSPVYKTIPLMQGFQTSAPKQTSNDKSTMDFFFFPEIDEPPTNPFAKLRVPLLPDNYSPDRSADSVHRIESIDEALPKAEISIVASHPENVAPVAMSEVVGNEAVDVELGQLITGFTDTALHEMKEQQGTIKDLWNGLIDDILGPKAGSKVAI